MNRSILLPDLPGYLPWPGRSNIVQYRSECGRTWTLSTHGGILRFKAHDKRKTQTQTTSRRWARTDSVWDVVGG